MATLDPDPSVAMPVGGYLLPNFPGNWFDNAPNMQQLAAGADLTIDTIRLWVWTMAQAHKIQYAVGTDLDDIGAKFGIPRGGGEGDTQYRQRIPAAVAHGISASSKPGMQYLLSQAFNNMPVSADDVLGSPGMFQVTFFGVVPLPQVALAMISKYRALGMRGTARMMLNRAPPTATTARVGAAQVGRMVVGGNRQFVPIPGLA